MVRIQNALKNIEINEDFSIFTVNPKIYSLKIVYSAAYILIDKAFIVLDGDPEKEIIVEIRRKKENQSLRELTGEFNEELLNYAVHYSKLAENSEFRNTILQKIANIPVKNDNQTQ